MDSSNTRVIMRESDAQLVDLAKQGQHEAFNELIRRHWSRCANVAAYILRNRGEAEEETQNACWKAFQHIGNFHGESEFSTWLMRIVENQCLMLIRHKRRAQFVHLDSHVSEHHTQPIQLPTLDADPEAECGSREVLQVLKLEMRRVPPLLRNVLMMRDVEELPMNDLADRLGISVAAAKSRLQRARSELRKRMLRHCTSSGPSTLLSPSGAPLDAVFHQSMRNAVDRMAAQ
jgi:RNA polymerase sigma-70 factor (ECF subfamily)